MSLESTRINEYSFGKLCQYTVEPFMRIFGREGDGYFLELIEEFRNDYIKASSHDNFDMYVYSGLQDVTARAADTLIARWLRHANPVYRRFAVNGLARLRLRRIIEQVMGRLFDNDEDSDVRTQAGIALGEISGVDAANALAREIRRGGNGPGIDWAFSVLYPQPIDWSDCTHLADGILRGDGEVRQQLLYAMGVRQDQRFRSHIEAGLSAPDPFTRGTSALALSRLLGMDAHRILDGRDREASDDLELAFILSAQIVSGDLTRGLDLDAVLQRLIQNPLLRRCWRRKILSALAFAEHCQRRAELWAEITDDELSHYQAELAPTLPTPTGRAVEPVEPANQARAGHGTKVFVSYSHRDKTWLERFQYSLAPLVRKGTVDLWDDTKLKIGSKWHTEIDAAMDEARVALFLVSRQFLASDFIVEHELPRLLQAAKDRNAKIVWVLLDDCLWEETELKDYPCANDPAHPLKRLSRQQASGKIIEICRSLRDLLAS